MTKKPEEMEEMRSDIPEVTLIMPVYNVERYLREAVDSVIAQTFKNWELILVDDGSPDGCPRICDEYSRLDSRIRVIHKPNGGQGAARNDAIKVARGKYIGFVDSDDSIEPDMYAKLHRAITESGADMAMCGYFLDFRGKSKVKKPLPEAGIYDGPTLMSEGYRDRKVQSISCDKLFKREVVSEGYPSQRYFEDHAVMLHWYEKVKKWVAIPEPLYHYRMRRSGVTNGFSIEKRVAKFDADMARARYMASLPEERHGMTKAEIAAPLIVSAVGTCKSVARECDDAEKALEVIKEITEKTSSAYEECREILPKKVAKRYELMKNRPGWFRRKMRMERMFVFAGNRKEKLLYD